MKGYLLDVNVLIALAWPNHTEHERVQEWFAKERVKGWATCLVTQLAFIRSRIMCRRQWRNAI